MPDMKDRYGFGVIINFVDDAIISYPDAPSIAPA